MKKIIILITFFLTVNAKIINYDIKPSKSDSNSFMNINILDSKELVFNDFNGIEISELSALAYKDNILYALSDRGYLYKFKLKIKNKKIISLIFFHH